MHLFSDEMRRNPYPVYDQMRDATPVLHIPEFEVWMVFDYEGVKRVLNDHESFSSHVGPEWLLFLDPPRHAKLRALIARAFTPRVIANLEPRIRELSRQLLDLSVERGEMDLADDFAVPLPMMVIAEMIGIPATDQARFRRWSDIILALSYDLLGGDTAAQAVTQFQAVTVEMDTYLAAMIEQRQTQSRGAQSRPEQSRQAEPQDNLLTRLVEAEVDGERLTRPEIVAFVQLLLVGGQETTTNLINNAILCLVEHRAQLARLQAAPNLLPAAIEEVLRYRSPFQWTVRVTQREVAMRDQLIPPGQRVLAVIGAANRDPHQFSDAHQFDLTRQPNPHLAFGHGIHFCLGAPLARLEAKIALTDLLARLHDVELASAEPWPPRRALQVHGPAHLPIRFKAARSSVAGSEARQV